MSQILINELFIACLETFYMVGVSGIFAILFGLPLGVILLITRPSGIMANCLIHNTLGFIVNATRSTPFIILLVAIIPLTRLLAGTSIGTTAAIVPLSIAAIPFVARLIENILADLADHITETGIAMGASAWQIIYKMLIPEAVPGIINSITMTIINLIGYSAMAGAVGGGGLGDLAYRYGYQRFNIAIMLCTIVILIVMVQLVQYFGDLLAKRFIR